jgi:polyisoprenoid-binding protein YceI
MSARHTIYKISPSPDSTLAIEIRKTGLVKRKHLFVFEQYSGELIYDPDQPLDSGLNISIEANSLVCRDSDAKPKVRLRLTRFALAEALRAQDHPVVLIQSQRFLAKPLRGFIAEGTLRFHGIDRNIKANVGFGVPKKGRVQLDADATLRLSDYNLPRPSSLFGLIHTVDEIVLHALIWGTIGENSQSNYASQANQSN